MPERSPCASTLIDLLSARLTHAPQRPVYTFLGANGKVIDTLDGLALVRRSAGVAKALTKQGVERGDRVLMVFPPDGVEFVVGFFGALLIGAVPVPTVSPDPRNPQGVLPLLRHIAENCQARAVLSHRRYRRLVQLFAVPGRVRGLLSGTDAAERWPDVNWLLIDQVPPADEAAARLLIDEAAATVSADDLAFLQYTSGSTSNPKGVMVRHRNVVHNLGLIARHTEVDEHSVLVSWVPLFHDMGLTGGLLNAVATGAHCVHFSPLTFLKNPALWLEAIERYRGTHGVAPNFGFEYLLRAVKDGERRFDLSSWRMAGQGGEPMQLQTIERVRQGLAPHGFNPDAFCNVYGLAETVLFASGRSRGALEVVFADAPAHQQGRVVLHDKPGPQRLAVVGCGTPDAKAGVSIEIVDAQTKRVCAPGEIGELWLCSPSNADGYWGWSEEENTACFKARLADAGDDPRRFVRTGDLGFVANGEVFLCGRHKDLIIVAGRNLYPQDLELTLQDAHHAVRRGCVACFGVAHDGGERVVVVAEVKRTDDPLDEIALALRDRLAEHHHLSAREVVLVEARSLPKTTSGKLQRGRCRALWADGGLKVRHRFVDSSSATGLAPLPAQQDDASLAEGAAPEEEDPRRSGFQRILAQTLGQREPIPHDAQVRALGLDSVQAIEVCQRCQAEIGVDVDASLLMDDLDLNQIWARLTGDHRQLDTATRPEPGVGTLDPVSTPISLMFFSSQDVEQGDGKYQLFTDAVRRADQSGLEAVWLPERHFHAFGGLFPNPSVLASAVAMITKRIRIRAGSVVLPLHDPIRVAEEWAVVDNLSAGRVDLAFASGWHQNDFAFAPERYQEPAQRLLQDIDAVRALWRGEPLSRRNGRGETVDLTIHPRPIQSDLAIWHTVAQSQARITAAGSAGANVLTALLFRSPEELKTLIASYRNARAEAGHDPDSGRVTLMLHTCVGDDEAEVMNAVRGPFREYLRSSIDLWRQFAPVLDDSARLDTEGMLDFAFARYARTSALFGTPAQVAEQINHFKALGVDEIACLIDFGVPDALTLRCVEHLGQLARATSNNAEDLGEFYDALSAESEGRGAQRAYLTFGGLGERDATFSWFDAIYRGQTFPHLAQQAYAAQKRLRQNFLAQVDRGQLRRVLDIGCGYGTDLVDLALAQPQLEAWGQTLSEAQAAIGRARAQAAGVGDRVHIVVGDSSKRLPDGPFDLIFGFEVACYIEDKHALLERIVACLAPEGQLVLADFTAAGTRALVQAQTSSFIPPTATWAALLEAVGLGVRHSLDLTRAVANFLHLEEAPDLEQVGSDEQTRAAIGPHLQAWTHLGRALERGLLRYQVWTFDRQGDHPSFEVAVETATPVDLSERDGERQPPALAGVRVLDLTRLLPGSMATHELCRLGAEVIKIELPHSADYMRGLEPPELPADAPRPFTRLNQGKQSLALDYRNPQGGDVLRRLVRDADVLVESDKPGSLARFGLDPESLLALNPRLVYASLTGFGQTGPWAQWPAHEMNIQALSGYLDLSRQAVGRPTPAALPIADMASGQQAALAIAAALRTAHETGRGAHVDVCAFDVLWRWSRAFGAAERPPGHPGRQNLLFSNAWPCYQRLESGDGVSFAVAPLERPFWDRFCALLGRPDLRPRAFDESAVPEVQREFSRRKADELRALFANEEICVTESASFEQAMAAPQAKARGLASMSDPAPRLGQHSRPLLGAAGLSDEQIRELAAHGVVVDDTAEHANTQGQ